MKFIVLTLIAAALPAIAWADGGHPVTGDAHALAHLVYFGIPIAAVGFIVAVARAVRIRLTR